jgi:hypothetical protein
MFSSRGERFSSGFSDQGDQIGQKFAQQAIVHFEQFLKIKEVALLLFFQTKGSVLI